MAKVQNTSMARASLPSRTSCSDPCCTSPSSTSAFRRLQAAPLRPLATRHRLPLSKLSTCELSFYVVSECFQLSCRGVLQVCWCEHPSLLHGHTALRVQKVPR